MSGYSIESPISIASKSLVGLRVESAIIGMGVGTAVLLEFGGLVNSGQAESRKTVDYSHSLFVQDGTWRLESSESVLVSSSTSSNDEQSPIVREFERLVGEKVTFVEVRNLGKDLEIRFSNGFNFLVFSAPIIDSTSNFYSIHTPALVVSLDFDGNEEVESRSTPNG